MNKPTEDLQKLQDLRFDLEDTVLAEKLATAFSGVSASGSVVDSLLAFRREITCSKHPAILWIGRIDWRVRVAVQRIFPAKVSISHLYPSNLSLLEGKADEEAVRDLSLQVGPVDVWESLEIDAGWNCSGIVLAPEHGQLERSVLAFGVLAEKFPSLPILYRTTGPEDPLGAALMEGSSENWTDGWIFRNWNHDSAPRPSFVRCMYVAFELDLLWAQDQSLATGGPGSVGQDAESDRGWFLRYFNALSFERKSYRRMLSLYQEEVGRRRAIQASRGWRLMRSLGFRAPATSPLDPGELQTAPAPGTRNVPSRKGRTGGFYVLACTPDRWALKALRVEAPLLSLYRQGLIDGYTIVTGDHEAKQVGTPTDTFQAIWIQREPDQMPWFSRYVVGQRPYLLDWDDLLGHFGGYSRAESQMKIEDSVLSESLREATVVSLSNRRLLDRILRYHGVDVSGKWKQTPNGLSFGGALPPALRRPKAILWTSSDYAALTVSREDVVGAIREFADRHQLPVLTVGHFREEVIKAVPSVRPLGKMDFWQHKNLLAEGAFIGVCPLETRDSDELNDFISCKSDLKMIEFGGFGHSGVYSDAEPYIDTDLLTGAVVSNDFESWTTALETAYSEHWKADHAQAFALREKRNMDRLARECWFPALESVREDNVMTWKEVEGWLRC